MIGRDGKRVGGFGEEGEPQGEAVDAGNAVVAGVARRRVDARGETLIDFASTSGFVMELVIEVKMQLLFRDWIKIASPCLTNWV